MIFFQSRVRVIENSQNNDILLFIKKKIYELGLTILLWKMEVFCCVDSITREACVGSEANSKAKGEGG